MYFLDEVAIDGLACGGAAVLRVIKFIFTLLDIILFLVPMGLIVMFSVDLAKNVIANKDNQMSTNVNLGIKRILFCIALFLISPVVSFVMDFAGNNGINFLKCVTIAKNDDLSQYEIKFEEDDYSDVEKPNITGDNDYNVTSSSSSSSSSSGISATSDGSCGGPYKGTTYNLTEEQLNGIANATAAEQTTLAGRAAEASLMANLFEMNGSSYGTGAKGLINYVATGPWFWSGTKTAITKTDSADPKTVEVVRDVLVNGNRTVPLYINEHDGLKDVIAVQNNGVNIPKNQKKLYQQGVTRITNQVKSGRHTWNFYCFPAGIDSNDDPFGYTDEAKKIRGLE